MALYRKTNAIIFIESSKEQAPKIARLASRPVICTEDGVLYDANIALQLERRVMARIKRGLGKVKGMVRGLS